jgi:hypothetical protein
MSRLVDGKMKVTYDLIMTDREEEKKWIDMLACFSHHIFRCSYSTKAGSKAVSWFSEERRSILQVDGGSDHTLTRK